MKSTKIAVVLLALVLVTSCLVGGTFAKYISTSEGTSQTARAAKWDIKLEGVAAASTFNFNLFETIVDTVDGEADAHVATSATETIIAPGTKGSFSLDLVNNSEVDAQYTVVLTVDDMTLPLTFKVGSTTYTTDQLAEGVTLADDVAIAKTNGTAQIVVEWEWAFNDSGVDNAYQNIPAPEATLDVTVEQVD